jgi:hypothetical protein
MEHSGNDQMRIVLGDSKNRADRIRAGPWFLKKFKIAQKGCSFDFVSGPHPKQTKLSCIRGAVPAAVWRMASPYLPLRPSVISARLAYSGT